jgi:hypothetical protein
MAADFGSTVANTAALFLYEAGIDIRLVRYQLYQTAADPGSVGDPRRYRHQRSGRAH